MKFLANARVDADDFEKVEIVIEAPNKKNSKLMLVQAMVNIVVYVVLFMFVLKRDIATMGMFVGFMCVSVITQVIMATYKSLEISISPFKVKYVSDKTKYEEYLKGQMLKIVEAMNDYEKFLFGNFNSSANLFKEVCTKGKKLWNRLPKHEDFVQLHLGNGFSPYPINVKFPDVKYDDGGELQKHQKDIEAKVENSSYKKLPVKFSLKGGKILTIANANTTDERIFAYMNKMVLDLAVLQSPQDLSLYFLLPQNQHTAWLAHLPHNGGDGYLEDDREASIDKLELLMPKIFANVESGKETIVFVHVDYVASLFAYHSLNMATLPTNMSVIFISESGNTPSNTMETVRIMENGTGILNNGLNLVLPMVSSADATIICEELKRIDLLDGMLMEEVPDMVSVADILDF